MAKLREGWAGKSHQPHRGMLWRTAIRSNKNNKKTFTTLFSQIKAQLLKRKESSGRISMNRQMQNENWKSY